MTKNHPIISALIAFILSTSLVACGGGTDTKSKTTQADINKAPTATISGVQSVNEGERVELTAQASDPDGDIISEYSWSISPEYNVELTKSENVITFTAPDVTQDVLIKVTLIVKDALGASVEVTHDLTITYVLPSYTVSVKETQNGSISPSSIDVNEGESYTFTINPAQNYAIDEVSGCEGELDGIEYTTGNISAVCEIEASFKAVPLSVQANIQETELAQCLDATNYTSISEVISLNCNAISDIQELSVFINIQTLVLRNPQFSGDIIFPHFPVLTSLSLSQNRSITSVDITDNTALEYLSISNTSITTLDLSMLTEIKELHIFNNALSELNTSPLTKLETFFAYGNELDNLDISQNLNLTVLDVSSNNLTTFNTIHNKELIQLVVSSNELLTVDLSGNPKLKYFNINGNKLTGIDLSSNPDLEKLWIAFNKLLSLDLTDNTKLNLVWAQSNEITNVSGIESITFKEVYFPIYNNRFTASTLSYLTNLKDNLGYTKLNITE